MPDGIFDTARRAYSGECGVEVDHDTEVVYEDDEMFQWVCRNCGGEGWEDKQARMNTEEES